MDNKSNSDFSQQKEKIGKIFIGAFDYCLNLMNGGQFHSGASDDTINQQSDVHGQKMFEFMLQTYRQIRETNVADGSSANESSFLSQLKIANEFFDLNKSNPLKRSGINSESKTNETNTSLDSTTSSTTSSTFVYKEGELPKDATGENCNNGSSNKSKNHRYDGAGQSSDLRINSSDSSHDNGEQLSAMTDARDEESKVVNKSLKNISFGSPTHSASSSVKTNVSETASNNSADEFDESNESDKLYIIPKKRSRRKKSVFISSKVKKSIAVSLALKHPNWKLKKIAEHSGYTSIRSYDVLRQWAAEIEKESETIYEMTESTENTQSNRSRSMSQDLNYGLEEAQHSILPDKYFRDSTGNEEPFISIQEMNNKGSCMILSDEDHRDPLGEATSEDIKPPVKGVKLSPLASDRTSMMLARIKNEDT